MVDGGMRGWNWRNGESSVDGDGREVTRKGIKAKFDFHHFPGFQLVRHIDNHNNKCVKQANE